jgi:hypothetical protein
MSEDDALKACLTCCAVCCWSIVLTISISAHVIGFVGLSRTRMIDLEPYCPHNYWEGSLTLIFLRVLVFSLATSIATCSKQMAEQGVQAGCVCCAVLGSLVFARYLGNGQTGPRFPLDPSGFRLRTNAYRPLSKDPYPSTPSHPTPTAAP